MWNFFRKIFTEAVVKLFVPKCPWCGLPVDRWLDLCGKEKCTQMADWVSVMAPQRANLPYFVLNFTKKHRGQYVANFSGFFAGQHFWTIAKSDRTMQ